MHESRIYECENLWFHAKAGRRFGAFEVLSKYAFKDVQTSVRLPGEPGRAVVLRIEPPMASRPFGLPSLTPARFAYSPGDQLVASPSPPRVAWRPCKSAEQAAPDRLRCDGQSLLTCFMSVGHRCFWLCNSACFERNPDRTSRAAWRTPHACQPPARTDRVGGMTAALLAYA